MKIVKWILGFVVLVGLGIVGINYYSFIFSKQVNGVVIDVQKVELSNTILTRQVGDLPYMHSFAIAIKINSGEIMTSSAEDRQWAVVKAGQCVEARFFPYPPWDFQKAGTFFGARLLKLSDCPSETK